MAKTCTSVESAHTTDKARGGSPQTSNPLFSWVMRFIRGADVQRDTVNLNTEQAIVPTPLTLGSKTQSADEWLHLSHLEFLNEKQAAVYVCCSVSKLRSDRHKATGLPYSKCGKSVRYSRKDIDAFMLSNRVNPV